MKFTGTTTRFVIVAAVLLAAVAGVFFFMLVSIERQMQKLTELQESVALAQDREQKLSALKATVRAVESDRMQLDSFFLQENDLVSFLETIEGLSSTTRSRIEVVSVEKGKLPLPVDGKVENQPIFSTIRLSIATDGSWESVFHTLSLLESLPVPLIMHRATFDVAAADTVPPTWKGTFVVSVVEQ